MTGSVSEFMDGLLETDAIRNPTDLYRLERSWVTGVMPQHDRQRRGPDDSAIDRETVLDRFERLREERGRRTERLESRLEGQLGGPLRDFGVSLRLQPTVLVGISSEDARASIAPG